VLPGPLRGGIKEGGGYLGIIATLEEAQLAVPSLPGVLMGAA